MSMRSGQVHFRCVFDVSPATEAEGPWSVLVKTIRNWVSERPGVDTNPAFYSSWFYTSGAWAPPGGRGVSVRTDSVIGNGTEGCPQYWTMCFEHPCRDHQARCWRTDLGITKLGDASYRLSLVTAHQMRPNFMGADPPMPMPSAPGIVGKLTGSPFWRCTAGDMELRPTPKPLKVGEGVEFRDLLASTSRWSPVVCVSRDFTTGMPRLDAGALARFLAGAATVFLSESSEVDKELEWCLRKKFSCWNGMVRVYQPGVKFDSQHDFRRHRFIWGKEIDSLGIQQITEMIVAGVCRRASLALPDALTSIDDVAVVRREIRLRELRESAGGAETKEWVAALEEINGELEASNRTLTEDNKNLRKHNAGLEDSLAQRDEDMSRLQYEKKSAYKQMAELKAQSGTLQSKIAALQNLATLPDNIGSVARTIQDLWPERIAFTEKALSSAADAKSGDIHATWRCFWAMATDLHELFFGDNAGAGNLEEQFRATSGFELAMTEGEMTKSDQKLMRLREETFQGNTIDITPHVKLDKDSTRAYFCPYQSDGQCLVVVGFVGHLKTAGTRRRKN